MNKTILTLLVLSLTLMSYGGNTGKGSSEYKGKYPSLGIGIGPGYGGAGLRAQYRIGDIQGVGLHAGVGSVSSLILVSGGVKYYPYKDLYINAQYGAVGVQEIQTVRTINTELLYGTSFLIGSDWTWGSKIGYGFNFGIGTSYTHKQASLLSPGWSLALDLGFIVRF